MAVHVGEAALDAVVIKAELLVIEPEQVKGGRVQVVAVRGIFLGSESEIIAAAVGGASFDAAACHPGREGTGIVIAAFARALGGGLATELGGANHQSAIEQAA